MGPSLDVENIDFSPAVIDNMRERNLEKRPSMKWLVMDIMKLDYANSTFDIVLDKGTMDAIMCEKGDVWDPSEDLVLKIDTMLSEVVRVLKPGGKYIYVTFGQPHFRKPFLLKEKYGWTLQQETIGTCGLTMPSFDQISPVPSSDMSCGCVGECFHYFIYVLTKKSE